MQCVVLPLCGINTKIKHVIINVIMMYIIEKLWDYFWIFYCVCLLGENGLIGQCKKIK